MTTKEPLSKQWRINKSSIPAIELANGLRATHNFIGHVLKDSKTKQRTSVQYGDNSRYTEVFDHETGNFKTNDKSLTLRASIVMGEYPIPDEKMDQLCGHAIHEALHKLLESPQVLITQIPQSYGLSGNTPTKHYRKGMSVIIKKPDALKNLWHRFLIVSEEIACDNSVDGLLREYIRRSRDMEPGTAKEVNWDDVFSIWIAIDVYNMAPEMGSLDANKLKALGILLTVGKQLKSKQSWLPDFRHRISLYVDTWKELEPLLNSISLREQSGSKPPEGLEGIKDDVFGDEFVSDDDDKQETPPVSQQGSGKSTEEPQADAQNTKPDTSSQIETQPDDIPDTSPKQSQEPSPQPTNGQPTNMADQVIKDFHGDGDEESLSEAMSSEVMNHLEADSEDLTSQMEDIAKQYLETLGTPSPEIQREIKSFGEGTNQGVVWSKAIDREPVKDFDENLLRELEWVRNLKKSLGHTIYRPEEEGVVDELNLHRFLIDGHIYKRKVEKPDQKLKLALLLDASSSMDNKKEIYQAAFALAKILPKVPVYSYSTTSNTVNLELHTFGKELREVNPVGYTPSSQAILGVAVKHPDYFIIHFTDGHANRGSMPLTAFKLLAYKFPKVFVLNVLYNQGDRSIGGYQYENRLSNNDFVMISELSQFPELLKQITSRIVTSL